jgi:hypothetical protein
LLNEFEIISILINNLKSMINIKSEITASYYETFLSFVELYSKREVYSSFSKQFALMP